MELFGQREGVQALLAFLGTAVTGTLALYRVALILMLAIPRAPSFTWWRVSGVKRRRLRAPGATALGSCRLARR